MDNILTIDVEDLPVEIRMAEERISRCRRRSAPAAGEGGGASPPWSGLRRVGRAELARLLEEAGGNMADVARRLGVNRSSVLRKARKLGLV